ncbi:hypothetical protein [Paraburkholderia strydomiana]|uniref:Phage tail protein n=1 Tax=Paraburkholderia strydomiana TaxID=1245417 RepID=A0ABW9C2N8_9BURK
MTSLQKVNLGTAPTGTDGDPVRTAFAKINSNVDVFNAQAALTSATGITAAQALTAAHIGKRINIALATAGAINLPAASTCAADNVLLLRNIGTTVVTLAITAGSGDTIALSKLNPGETALMDTDGVHAWTVLMRGRSNSDNEIVVGNLTVGGGGSFASRPTFSGNTPWDSGNLPLAILSAMVEAQCRLTCPSATQIALVPYQGNNVPINGALYTLPNAGVTLASTSLSANTLYYIYAIGTGSAVSSLEASTTGYTMASTGQYTKTGDVTRLLVGMARTNGSAQFVDSMAAGRCVLSWFNQRFKPILGAVQSGAFGTTTMTTQGTPTPFCVWANSEVRASMIGYVYANSVGAFVNSVVQIDSAINYGPAQAAGAASTTVSGVPLSLTVSIDSLSEGYHTMGLASLVSSGTGYLSWSNGGGVWG